MRTAAGVSAAWKVQCAACRATNDRSEERCTRCGKRLHLASPQAAPETYLLGEHPQFETIQGGGSGGASPTYQPSLFRDPATSKIVPIPTMAPVRGTADTAPRRSRSTHRSRLRAASEHQQVLAFPDAAETLAREESICCDAPVAAPVHRVAAAAVDAGLIGAALGLFLGVFLLAGGQIALTRSTMILFASAFGTVALFYKFLFCISGGDSPGMHFVGLRTIDFDGRKPKREQRFVRLFAGVMSFCAAGLGVLWALVDEENLTWHDHIAKTFPSPVEHLH